VAADPFDYVAASSWQEAVDLLQQGGEDAKAIAGGQSLIPMLTLRLATPRLLVDVLAADRPRVEPVDGLLRVSAVTRHVDLERDAVVAGSCPILARAASLVGNVRVRNRGTIGGSLAHADPSAEIPCVATALGGRIRTLGPEGEREMPAAEFFQSYFTTALAPAEVVTSVDVPVTPSGAGWSFTEMKLRSSDFAVVAVAAVVELDTDGRYSAVRLAAAGVGERPRDLAGPAAALLGEAPSDAAWTEAGRRCSEAVEPTATVHVSADYRRAMTAVFVARALAEATGRAEGAAA
jgi:CO/xanthine dehydrogenase FAD-binding subunit